MTPVFTEAVECLIVVMPDAGRGLSGWGRTVVFPPAGEPLVPAALAGQGDDLTTMLLAKRDHACFAWVGGRLYAELSWVWSRHTCDCPSCRAYLRAVRRVERRVRRGLP